jgi:hypothetical protein
MSTESNASASEIRLDDILPLNAFCKRYPDLATVSGLQWLLFRQETNGIVRSGALVKRNNRWFVCIPKYRDWLLNGPPSARSDKSDKKKSRR